MGKDFFQTDQTGFDMLELRSIIMQLLNLCLFNDHTFDDNHQIEPYKMDSWIATIINYSFINHKRQNERVITEYTRNDLMIIISEQFMIVV